LKEIGEQLCRAREEKGISLEEISRQTKIQPQYLVMMEKGDFSAFAGEVYVKGALRNYAEAVGLEPSEIISLYRELTGERGAPPEKDINREKSAVGKPILVQKESIPFSINMLVWIILLVAVAGGGVWYYYQSQTRGEETGMPFNNEIYNDEEEEAPWSELNEDEEDEPETVEPPPVEPELAALETGEREAVYLLKGAEQKDINISFTARCWVRVEQDGRLVEEKNYEAGAGMHIGDGSETWIRLGFPAAAEVTVNGIPLENLSLISSPFNVTIRKAPPQS